jgi:outer membrane lipoprotein SlyB
MKKTIVLTLILSTCFFYGCVANRPIVDMRGRSQWAYENDFNECQKYADQVSTGTSVAAGAGAGAGLGALAGLIVGIAFNVNPGELAGFGAAIGGLQGAAAGGSAAVQTKDNIVKNCMRGRGYNVLN